MRSLLSRSLICAAALLSALGASSAVAESAHPAGMSFNVERLLDTRLSFSGGSATVAAPDLQAAIESRLLRFDAYGRLEVHIRTLDVASTIADVERTGGKFLIADQERGVVQALVPLGAVGRLLDSEWTKYISEPAYALVNRGSVRAESYSRLQIDVLRSAFGAEGRNVRIGVISDGVGGIESAQASGDLPAVNTTTCNVVPGADPQASGAEGTALLEIVHDLAPKAELWFGNYAFNTYLYFNEAVRCLARHVDVIVDDISWFTIGPFDGTGPVSQNVTQVMRSGDTRVLAYVTAVGNYARRHWSADFSQCQGGELQLFEEGNGTVDRDRVGPRCNNPVAVGPGATLMAFLQWNDPFYSSCNDYDLLLFAHDSPGVLAQSASDQHCAASPVEVISWRNDSGTAVTVDLAVQRRSPQEEPVRFNLFIAGGIPNFYTPAGSIGSVADSPDAIAVGAVDASDPGLDDIQPYSSLGPSAAGIVKPDIVAPDCVSVTGSGGFSTPFCGTSAAAPHVAGVLGLLVGCNGPLHSGEARGAPRELRSDLRRALLNRASDRPPLGADNTWGHGLINPLASAQEYCKPHEVVAGNVNCDTRVDALDALYLLRHTASLPPDALCIGAGDVNCSGAKDAIDALAVLRYAAGLTAIAVPPGCPPIGVVPGTR